jgi:TPR repeat protein
MFRIGLFLTAFALAAPARADDLVAVMEMESVEDAMVAEDLKSLTDTVRETTAEGAGRKYGLVSRETMAATIPAQRLACSKATCAVEIGRRLRAAYVLVGRVRRQELSRTLTLEAYETRTGKLAGVEEVTGRTAAALSTKAYAALPARIGRWLSAAAKAASAGPVEAELEAMLRYDVGLGGQAMPEAARRERYNQACASGDLFACDLAAAKRLPLASRKGLDGESYAGACEIDMHASCVGAAYALAPDESGRGASAKEVKRALAAAQKLCDAGTALACEQLAGLLRAGKGVKKDGRRAAEAYKKACDAGAVEACLRLASMHAAGEGVEQDAGRAVELYADACERGLMDACASYGLALAAGNGVPEQDAKAVSYYQRACNQGSGAGCRLLGRALRDGEGATKDEKRGRELFLQACEAKDALGCNLAGIAFAEGAGGPKDMKRARELFRKACDGGHKEGCSNARKAGG